MNRSVTALACALTVLCSGTAASARQEPGCSAARAEPPTSSSPGPSGPVLQVTDRNDAAHPVVVTYEHTTGVNAAHYTGVGDQLLDHLVQVRSRARKAHLWVRIDFTQPPTDVDLYLYDAIGNLVGWSESSNDAAEDAVGNAVFYPSDTGGPGFENIDGLPVKRCQSLMVETENSRVVGSTPVRLAVWLGPAATGGHD